MQPGTSTSQVRSDRAILCPKAAAPVAALPATLSRPLPQTQHEQSRSLHLTRSWSQHQSKMAASRARPGQQRGNHLDHPLDLGIGGDGWPMKRLQAPRWLHLQCLSGAPVVLCVRSIKTAVFVCPYCYVWCVQVPLLPVDLANPYEALSAPRCAHLTREGGFGKSQEMPVHEYAVTG